MESPKALLPTLVELTWEALIERVLRLEVRLRETEQKLAEAEAQIAELHRQLFGPKAEHLSASQQAQLDQLATDLREEAQKPSPFSQEVLAEERRSQRRRRAQRPPPRHPLPAVLETETVTLEPPSTPCPSCGSPRQRIGEEVTEEIDLIPSRRAG